MQLAAPVASPRSSLRRSPEPRSDREFSDALSGAGTAEAGPPDVLAVPVGAGRAAGPGAARIATRYGLDLATVLAAEAASGTAAEVVRVPVQAPDGVPARLLLVGVGAGTPIELRRAGAALARAVRGRRHCLTTLGDGADAEALRALVEGLLLGGYGPPTAGIRSRAASAAVRHLTLLGDHPATALEAGQRHADATVLARDLAEAPSNLKTPEWFVQRARELAGGTGLRVTVLDVEQLAAQGFGGLLAVGSGSASPPRLLRLDHRPPGRGMRPAVLVGKGITFDTGGLSIKPREAMLPMRTDMSGGAAALAAIIGCARQSLPRPVTALIPLAENAVGGSSYRPGDVLRIYGGRTVEILNTDAEGRIVLADALSYAVHRLDPAVIVDIATLTGAATIGLGRRHAAMYATDDVLAAELAAAGDDSGERVWRMPLVEDYRPALDSTVADLRHVPADGKVGGGSITAALFLREFTGGRRWAHLDIAGPARADKDEHEVGRGATGYGARLLLRWLESGSGRAPGAATRQVVT